MKTIKTEEIVKIINEISEENTPEITQYLDFYFTQMGEIDAFKDQKFNGLEQEKYQDVLTGMIKVSTLTSTMTVLKVLERLGVISNESV